MLETAFTLLGTAVSWLELLAFVLALANIACNVAEIHWGWPLTIVASLLYAWLFYASKLYGEAGVNIFFAATGVWGWWQWLRGHRGDSGAPLRIARLDSRGLLWCISGFALAWLLLGLLLRGVTDSDVPWADGLVTAGSLIGTLLLGRKFIENWPVWLAVNAASVALFAYKGLHLTVVLYVIFFLLAIWGWLGWSKRMAGAKIVVSTAKIVMPGYFNVIPDSIRDPVPGRHWIADQDAMDASLPTGKELRPLNAKSMNSRLSGARLRAIEVDPLMDTASKCPGRDRPRSSLTP